MPAANDVRPGRWANTSTLYDNGWYSAIWGTFSDADGSNPRRCLGVRWNGQIGNVGYPNQGRYPLWYVEPDILTPAILHRLHDAVAAMPSSSDRTEKLANIAAALAESAG